MSVHLLAGHYTSMEYTNCHLVLSLLHSRGSYAAIHLNMTDLHVGPHRNMQVCSGNLSIFQAVIHYYNQSIAYLYYTTACTF